MKNQKSKIYPYLEFDQFLLSFLLFVKIRKTKISKKAGKAGKDTINQNFLGS
jgi:hypothetical protein